MDFTSAAFESSLDCAFESGFGKCLLHPRSFSQAVPPRQHLFGEKEVLVGLVLDRHPEPNPLV